MQVVTFNVLAAPWADSNSYPAGASIFLNRVYRRNKSLELLRTLVPTTDVIALQETTPTEFSFYSQNLPEFIGTQVNHDPSYWSNYITEHPPWELNGVALFLKKTRFRNVTFSDLKNTEEGNHAAYAEAIHIPSGKKVGIASTHLDSDVSGIQNKEINAVIDFLKSRNNQVDVIAGDFNHGTATGNFSKDLQKNGYLDVLRAVGNLEKTDPYDGGYTNSTNYGIIDHIVVRGASPQSGDVIDNNLWNLYPDDKDTRVTENLRLIGSDHFPVWAKISF